MLFKLDIGRKLAGSSRNKGESSNGAREGGRDRREWKGTVDPAVEEGGEGQGRILGWGVQALHFTSLSTVITLTTYSHSLMLFCSIRL